MIGECTDQSRWLFEPNLDPMGGLTIESWAIIAVVIGTAVFGTLYILSSILRDAARRVDLYKRVAELRADYARQMTEQEERGFKAVQYAEAVDFSSDRQAA